MTKAENEKLDKILATVQSLEKAEAARVEREKQVREDVDALQATVNGNGQDGLKTTVALIKGKLNTVIAVLAAIGTISLGQVAAIAILFLTHQLPGWNP